MGDNELIGTDRIQQIVGLIDLTDLGDNCHHAAIESLCDRANTPAGRVAAICIWPEFVSQASEYLGRDSKIKIATVVNFPSGEEPVQSTCNAIETALLHGANEIDYVLPYKALINGNTNQIVSELQNVRNTVPEHVLLKIILETGELKTNELIRMAATIALEHGANFIKTSTGKVPINATPDAATVMLDTIAQTQKNVGFKAAGGIKTVADANTYLALAEKRLGNDWPDSSHFRFGASGLLQDALIKLKLEKPATADKTNY